MFSPNVRFIIDDQMGKFFLNGSALFCYSEIKNPIYAKILFNSVLTSGFSGYIIITVL